MAGRKHRGLRVALAACCISAWLLVPQGAAAGDGVRVNRALLIGVDDFASWPSIYPASTNNVFAVQEVLQASSTPFASIMIPDGPLTGTRELTMLIHETFGQSDDDDVNYLYLCTHGEYDGQKDDEPALLLSDGNIESRLTPRTLQAALRDIKGTKVLWLDACYSGAFIGKGMPEQPRDLYFVGEDYKVITSSGAMEESWYWNTVQSQAADLAESPQGAFYFTQALCQCLSPRHGFPADCNRDGSVTLHELYGTLLECHAASTPQVYPQEDDFVVFTYEPDDLLDSAERSPIGDVTFSVALQGDSETQLSLEFIALRPVRVAYQIVSRLEGAWRFAQTRLVYDNVEQYTAFGDVQGAITAGRKVRKLSLQPPQGTAGGYVLVQLVSLEGDQITVHAGKVVAVSPATGDLALGVEAATQYRAEEPRELAIFVRHAYPCLLSVTVQNKQGETVRRLSHKQSTRPLGMSPEGSTFYWDGCDKHGEPLPTGQYRVLVTGYLGDAAFTAESKKITLVR